MELFDRLKLTEDYKLANGIILTRGTIGTCRQIDEEKKKYILQVPIFISNPPNVFIVTSVSIPDLILEKVTMEDLNNYLSKNKNNYEHLTPRIYHINNLWSVKVGYDDNKNEIYKAGIIIKYNVQLNENDDTVIIKFFNDNLEKEYKKRYLEQFGSYSVIID